MWISEWKNGKEISAASLWEALHMDEVSFPQVIAIVGSGGKTSLMGRLAQEGKEHNLRVAVLTTTHIRKPPVYQEVFSGMEKGRISIFGQAVEKGRISIFGQAVEKGRISVFGQAAGNDKITYPGDACYEEICCHADLILIEADGSRGLPVKYPAEHEPVIPENVTRILCVSGMSGLLKPLEEVCHRWELAEQKGMLAEQGMQAEEQAIAEEMGVASRQLVTEKRMAKLLQEGYGKPLQQAYPNVEIFYCLNQADSVKLQRAAKQILEQIADRGVILSLLQEENILYKEEKNKEQIAVIYMASGFGRRYGSNKLLEKVEGQPLYLHGLQTLKEVAEIVAGLSIVVVSQYHEILTTARQMGCMAIQNANSHEGITASIHLGIQAAPEADAYLFAVADQPWVRAESIVRLVEEFCGSEKTIACLTDGKRRGNPVIFSKKYKAELLELTGDRGGSVLMKQYPQELLRVTVSEKELMDVDIPEALEKS